MTSAVEIARKQRYMYLLQKVRQSQPLSAAEIEQLQRLEKIMKKNNSSVTKKIRASRKKRKRPLTDRQVVQLAMQAESTIEADGLCEGLKEPLAKILQQYPTLQRAWQRGRFLRQLRVLAGIAVSVSEAARRLGMTGPQLRDMLDSDRQAAEIWHDARLQTLVEVKTAMLESAKAGRPAAIKQIEQMLRQEFPLAGGQVDLEHINTAQLVQITGKTRQTIHEWVTKYRLPRNSDKTFSLTEFFRWYENFTVEKFVKRPGQKLYGNSDPLREMKAEQLRMEVAARRGELLDRNEVLAGLLNRQQRLVNLLDRQVSDLAMACQLQPAEKITDILRQRFLEIRRQLCELPAELRLPADVAAEFERLLRKIGSNLEGRRMKGKG